MPPASTTKLIAASLTAIAMTVAGCAKGPQGPPPTQAMQVQVQTVTLHKVDDFTDYVSTIQSRGSSIVQPQVEGQLTRIFVHSGQQVRAGQPLMQIDPLKQIATVNNSEAARQAQLATMQNAKTQLDRTKQLYAAGVVAKQDFDNAQTAYDSAAANVKALQAGVNEQKEQLRYYTVSALTKGTVGDIPVKLGDRVTNTTLLTTLDSGGGLEAYIYIPAEKAADVKPGTPVDLQAEDGALVRTKVTFISPRIDPANQLLLVKAAVPPGEGRFRNQQTIHTRIIWKQTDSPTVPLLAVSRQSNQIFAFIVGQKDGKDVAEQRSLQTSGVSGNSYVVTGGVKPGDQLIVSGVQLLADGAPVKPMPAPPQQTSQNRNPQTQDMQ